MSYQITRTNKRLMIFGCYNELPEKVFQDLDLTHLRIEGNCEECLTKLTPRISTFSNLQSLIIAKTALKELPKEIIALRKLKELRIINCRQFTSLPNEIGNLANLEILDAWRSGITELPETIFELKSLKQLIIGRNRISKEQHKKVLEDLSNLERHYL